MNCPTGRTLFWRHRADPGDWVRAETKQDAIRLGRRAYPGPCESYFVYLSEIDPEEVKKVILDPDLSEGLRARAVRTIPHPQIVFLQTLVADQKQPWVVREEAILAPHKLRSKERYWRAYFEKIIEDPEREACFEGVEEKTGGACAETEDENVFLKDAIRQHVEATRELALAHEKLTKATAYLHRVVGK